jgi:putative ABC transport system substrate-binding protein
MPMRCQVKRRKFITIAGSVAAFPISAHAQQSERVRRIGILHDQDAIDPEGRAQITALRDALQELGWIEGRNALIDYRSGATEAEGLRTIIRELMAHKPDVVLTGGATITAALQGVSRSVPIVFVNATDPVGAGLVASLGRPEGNASGFTQFEFGISAKWLELLKEVAPAVTRVAVIRDPTARTGGGQLGAIQAVAPSLRVDVRPVDPNNPDEIDRALNAFARAGSGGGLIVTSSRLARIHRDRIVALAARHRLPAIYAFRVYVASGGLMSYGADAIEPYRRAAGYIDRILKGEKPAELPVQAPTKYQLVINVKTAKALGLVVPPSLLARIDEVIE